MGFDWCETTLLIWIDLEPRSWSGLIWSHPRDLIDMKSRSWSDCEPNRCLWYAWECDLYDCSSAVIKRHDFDTRHVDTQLHVKILVSNPEGLMGLLNLGDSGLKIVFSFHVQFVRRMCYMPLALCRDGDWPIVLNGSKALWHKRKLNCKTILLANFIFPRCAMKRFHDVDSRKMSGNCATLITRKSHQLHIIDSYKKTFHQRQVITKQGVNFRVLWQSTFGRAEPPTPPTSPPGWWGKFFSGDFFVGDEMSNDHMSEKFEDSSHERVCSLVNLVFMNIAFFESNMDVL